MKWEYLKGSEKDFEFYKDEFLTLWRTPVKSNVIGSTRKSDDHEIATQQRWDLIAERRPITEPSENCTSWREVVHAGIANIERGMRLAVEWDGVGLPPVGAECEFCSHSHPDSWHSGIVRYLSEHTIVIEFSGMVNGKAESISHPVTMKFRPIRSPEDVAREKERSEECDKIFGILSGVDRTGNCSDMAEALYDAGYRKME